MFDGVLQNEAGLELATVRLEETHWGLVVLQAVSWSVSGEGFWNMPQ